VAEDVRKLLYRSFLAWARLRLCHISSRNPKDIGAYGEEVARWELERRGYQVRDRNVRNRLGEIDIVAQEGSTLVFVEVKTRTGIRFGSPVEAVDRRKQRKLIRLAEGYIARKKLHDVPIRFDIVGVELTNPRKPVIRLYRNAFEED
jgi:putative endonuclease